MEHDLNCIEFKSLLFWTSVMSNAGEKSLQKQLWFKKDVVAFQKFYTECPYCNASPVWSPNDKNGNPIVRHGVLIETIFCFCKSIEILADIKPRWYESQYSKRFLDDIAEIDIPAGAGKQTAEIKGAFKKFLLNPTRSALITGNPGSGKTHILQALKTHFGGFAVYLTMADFFDRLMNYTTTNKSEKLQGFLSQLRHAPVLLLDDYGMQHMTEWGVNAIASILDYRYNLRRIAPVIMTTNLSLEQMAEGGTIRNMERVASRMMDTEFSTVMITLQADYRSAVTKKKIR